MRIGISVSSSHPSDDPRVGAANMVARARAAAQAHLDSLFVGDHHVTPFAYYQNTPILGRMLAEWGDKPYGALYLLPLWHPVVLAEQIATLASIGEGRFIMQCGLGDARQGDAMGIDMSKRVGMFEASLGTMRALWAGESVDEPRYWNIRGASIAPLPAQPVDVWIGSVAQPAIHRTARLGDGWLAAPSLTPDEAADSLNSFRQACAEFDRSPTAVAIRRDIFVGATREQAQSVVAPYVDAGYRGMNPDALMYGSAEEVAEQMAVFEQQGYTDVIVRNLSSDQGESLATIERLAEVKSILDRA